MANDSKTPPAGGGHDGHPNPQPHPRNGGQRGGGGGENRKGGHRFDGNGRIIEIIPVTPYYDNGYGPFNNGPFNNGTFYNNTITETPSVGANQLTLPDGFVSRSGPKPEDNSELGLGNLTVSIPGMHGHTIDNSPLLYDANNDPIAGDRGVKAVYDPDKVRQMAGADADSAATMAQNIADRLAATPAAAMVGPNFVSQLTTDIRSKWNGTDFKNKSMTDLVADDLAGTSQTMLGSGRDHTTYLQERLHKDYNIDLAEIVGASEPAIRDTRVSDMATMASRLGITVDDGKSNLGTFTVAPLPAVDTGTKPGTPAKPANGR